MQFVSVLCSVMCVHALVSQYLQHNWNSFSKLFGNVLSLVKVNQHYVFGGGGIHNEISRFNSWEIYHTHLALMSLAALIQHLLCSLNPHNTSITFTFLSICTYYPLPLLYKLSTDATEHFRSQESCNFAWISWVGTGILGNLTEGCRKTAAFSSLQPQPVPSAVRYNASCSPS